MSTLKVNTIQNTSAAHSSTPEEIRTGRAKAWWSYNQTTPAIANSYNISSITDNATGNYTANFSNTLTSPTGVTSGSYNSNAFAGGWADATNLYLTNTTGAVECINLNQDAYDLEYNYGVIYDDG